MQLYDIHNLQTLITDTTAGPCACLILPSHTLSRESISRCRVCQKTGKLPKQHPEPTFVRFTTLLEMNWAAYREGANKNFKIIRDAHKHPALAGNLTKVLSNWMDKLPDGMELCKVFYGGDVFSYDEMLCVIEAAKRNPDKMIYMQTGKHNCLSALENQISQMLAEIPDNLIIGMEMQCTCLLPLGNFMRVNYTNDPASTIDKTFFPTVQQADVHLQLSPFCVEALRKREPVVSSLLHPKHDYKPDTDNVY